MKKFLKAVFERAVSTALKYRKTAAVLAASAAVFLILNLVFPLPAPDGAASYSVLHMTEEGKLLRITLSDTGKYRIKMGLDEISAYAAKGFTAYEDRWFYFHPGINPASLLRAVFLNSSKGRVVSGGSTITMQLAKMREPKKRTYAAKIMEAFRAVQLEIKYSKKELLEMYLNTVPMGGNIEGIAAASFLYFNKHPKELSPGEASLLIALPKNPNRLRPDKNLKAAYEARDNVLERTSKLLKLSGTMLSAARNEKYPGRRFENPYIMPHLVNRAPVKNAPVIRYTINPAIQGVAEYRLADLIRRIKHKGVHNGAVIVIENKTMKVRAYCGSPDFNDKKHAGEIDGVNIYRSPGSALKPLLYGLGVDAGIITPKKVLYDIPREYDGYFPVNSQKTFIGPVTAQAAITKSLNSTAVWLERELMPRGLLYTLKKSGFTGGPRRSVNPGLSVVLGTYPMTLEEMSVMFAAIANKGLLKPPVYAAEAKQGRAYRIMSPEAAFIISEMLASGERPDLPQSWEFTHYRGKTAFKTGTSFGLIDAWCIGYTPSYTVGVWLGNADCSPSHELVGIKSAAPLMLEIMNFLTRFEDEWFVKPARVDAGKVCSLTGCLPGPHCKALTDDLFVKSCTVNRECYVHRQIYVNKKSGLRADPSKLKQPADAYEKRVVEEWPPEVAAFLRKAGSHLAHIPSYSREEAPDGSYLKPKILSPVNKNIYIYNSALPKEAQKIPLRAAAAGGAGEKAVWFVNGAIEAKGGADEEFFIMPEPGEYTVSFQDSLGNGDTVAFKVYEQ